MQYGIEGRALYSLKDLIQSLVELNIVVNAIHGLRRKVLKKLLSFKMSCSSHRFHFDQHLFDVWSKCFLTKARDKYQF